MALRQCDDISGVRQTAGWCQISLTAELRTKIADQLSHLEDEGQLLADIAEDGRRVCVVELGKGQSSQLELRFEAGWKVDLQVLRLHIDPVVQPAGVTQRGSGIGEPLCEH